MPTKRGQNGLPTYRYDSFQEGIIVIDLAKMLQYLRVTLCIALRVSLLLLHVF